jgi:protein TonB
VSAKAPESAAGAGRGGEGINLDGILDGYIGRVSSSLRRSYPYPLSAKRRGIEGTVILEVWVDAAGAILRAKVGKSSGHEVLDEAALAAVREVARVPPPPMELGWTERSITVPFRYRLGT